MIDLTRSTTASPSLHTVARDPGTEWRKDAAIAIDAPPDGDTPPPPDARWPDDAVRTGRCGSVSPRVIRLAAGGYRMYYTQILPRAGHPSGANDYDNATTRILSATSPDGRAWSPEAGVRLSPELTGAGELRVVSAEVVPAGDRSGRLRMYYESCPGPQSVENSIRSAVSEDGLAWRTEPGIRLQRPGRNFMAPRVVFLDDGRVRLYVTERGVGIVSAVSTDGGQGFELEPGPHFPDDPTAFAPEIVRLEGGGYRMYYASEPPRGSAAYRRGRLQIMTALSDDGLRWDRAPAPVVSPGGARWDAAKCSEMCVLALPAGAGGASGFRIVYEACDGTSPDERGVWRIAAAVSGVGS
jgi:hypothetical protein